MAAKKKEKPTKDPAEVCVDFFKNWQPLLLECVADDVPDVDSKQAVRDLLYTILFHVAVDRDSIKTIDSASSLYAFMIERGHSMNESFFIDDSSFLKLRGQITISDDMVASLVGDLLAIDESIVSDPETLSYTHEHTMNMDSDSVDLKKKNAVFYTPKYIVDYIVENTVGEKIKGKNPNEIQEVTILDPSCGGGNFLIGAFSYIQDYLIEYFSKLSDKGQYADDYEVIDGKIRLTRKRKEEIVENNLYGVDLDPFAVRVCTLNLYTCVLNEK
jgi:hypothetical protein